MAAKIVNKRKTAINITHPTEPKVRKTENIETMTKAAVVRKYKELEEEYKKVVQNNKLLREENESLSKSKNTNQVPVPKSDITTQTEDLLDEAEYPCSNCVYVAGCSDELVWHMKGKHGLGDPDYVFNYSCKICRKPYDVKDDLMNHIKTNHRRNMPLCKYFQIGACHFDGEKCWFIHEKEDQTIKSFKCGYCSKDFRLKSEFMIHRKTDHHESLRECINYRNRTCYYNEKCWYKHREETSSISSFSEY